MNKRGRIRRFSLCNFFPKNSRGTLLAENVIFLVLNLLFLSIVILFLFKQGSGAALLEESYAKNIALLVDSSEPVMELRMNMEQGFELAEKNGIERDDIVSVVDNGIFVKLSEKSGYYYSFFNDVDVTVYPDVYPSEDYIIKINGWELSDE